MMTMTVNGNVGQLEACKRCRNRLNFSVRYYSRMVTFHLITEIHTDIHKYDLINHYQI